MAATTLLAPPTEANGPRIPIALRFAIVDGRLAQDQPLRSGYGSAVERRDVRSMLSYPPLRHPHR